MEFEDLDEHVGWEARRVAAAFNLVKFSIWEKESDAVTFVGSTDNCDAGFVVRVDGSLYQVWVGKDESEASVLYFEDPFLFLPLEQHPHQKYDNQMVRGLYRLGFEDEHILAQLPELSAHEKLELRLSMPREFWPQKWFGEEGR